MTIADAKKLAKSDNRDMVIIFHFKDDQFGYVSYGKDRNHCQKAQNIADVMFSAIERGVR